MKKILFLILSLAIFLEANIDTKVRNILGYGDYNKHKNLINYIFKNKSSFYDENNKLDYTKVISALNSKGLIKLRYPGTRYVDIRFTISNNPKKSVKILKEILKSMGHYYYFTKDFVVSNNKAIWIIKLKTSSAINPLLLSRKLQRNNCKILDIKKEGYNWKYVIDTNNSKIDKSINLVDNNSVSVKKRTGNYLLKINSANGINIFSKSGNRWTPSIIFYDNDLNIIETYNEEDIKTNLRVDVPVDTKYIKIDDLHTPTNIKRGFTITKE